MEGAILSMEAIEVIGRTRLGIRMLSMGAWESLKPLLLLLGIAENVRIILCFVLEKCRLL